MRAPNELTITNGELFKDGMREAAETYLGAQQEKLGWPNGSRVCVIRREDLQKLCDEIEYIRSMMLCA